MNRKRKALSFNSSLCTVHSSLLFLPSLHEWMERMRGSFTWKGALVGLIIFLVTFTGSIAMASFLLVKLPATYFHSSHDRELWRDRHKVVRWTGIILKNLLGLILVVAGIIMAIPGVPGQGVLTILFGIMLLDFPGKRALELKLVSRPAVLSRINQLRLKFGKQPLVLD